MFFSNSVQLISLRQNVFALCRCMMRLRYQEITTMGSLGYSTHSKPCDQWLNSSEGRNRAADIKTLINISEVGYSLREGRFTNFLLRQLQNSILQNGSATAAWQQFQVGQILSWLCKFNISLFFPLFSSYL